MEIRWTLFLLLISIIAAVQSCNEAVCGSVVSKCLLTQSCNCNAKLDNCTCCKECYNCLNYLFSECCSCVDMCPQRNVSSIEMSSNVGDFRETIPALFEVITQEPDPNNHWNSTTFPVDIDLSLYTGKNILKKANENSEQDVMEKTNIITLNCTVVFMTSCMSNTKCKNTCSSMGASSYRWFHDGCCECIGQHCFNYGINESRCSNCPTKDPIFDELEEADDYGEDEDDEDFEED